MHWKKWFSELMAQNMLEAPCEMEEEERFRQIINYVVRGPVSTHTTGLTQWELHIARSIIRKALRRIDQSFYSASEYTYHRVYVTGLELCRVMKHLIYHKLATVALKRKMSLFYRVHFRPLERAFRQCSQTAP